MSALEGYLCIDPPHVQKLVECIFLLNHLKRLHEVVFDPLLLVVSRNHTHVEFLFELKLFLRSIERVFRDRKKVLT